jgi:hypothetical protein
MLRYNILILEKRKIIIIYRLLLTKNRDKRILLRRVIIKTIWVIKTSRRNIIN